MRHIALLALLVTIAQPVFSAGEQDQARSVQAKAPAALVLRHDFTCMDIAAPEQAYVRETIQNFAKNFAPQADIKYEGNRLVATNCGPDFVKFVTAYLARVDAPQTQSEFTVAIKGGGRDETFSFLSTDNREVIVRKTQVVPVFSETREVGWTFSFRHLKDGATRYEVTRLDLKGRQAWSGEFTGGHLEIDTGLFAGVRRKFLRTIKDTIKVEVTCQSAGT